MSKSTEAKKPKREYGSGSVSQRKDGTWTARIKIGTKEDGSPRIKAFYGKSEREVKRKLKEFKTILNKYDGVVAGRGTVGAYMSDWLYETKINELKPTSFDRLEQTLLYQVLPNIGELQLQALSSGDLQKMVNKLKKDGYSYSTVKKALEACNNCFTTGVIQHTLPFNPALGVTLPAKNQFTPEDGGDESTEENVKFYTVPEVQKLYAAATKCYGNGKPVYRLGYGIILAINTGLRCGELLGLKWSNVNLEERIIQITNTQIRVKDRTGTSGKKYITKDQKSTKTKSGIREMYLNDDAYDALLHLKEINGEFEYVLASEVGTPTGQRNFHRLLNKIIKAAGLPPEKEYGPHALRHTFASMLIANGENVKTVSELLGHSDTTVTYNTYVHLFKGQKISAVKRVGNFMSDLSGRADVQ